MLVVVGFIVQVRAESKVIYVDASNIGDPLEDGSIEHPFDRMQEGIDVAFYGDTIFVKGGNYREHVIVNKALTLIGENKETTVIFGSGLDLWYETAPPFWGLVTITTNNATISGFTIRDSERIQMGIVIRDSKYCNISGNIILNHEFGIDMRRSSYNFIGYNTISNCGIYGITMHEGSANNTLRNNNLTRNEMDLGVSPPYIHDIDDSNTIDGKPIYYWVNESNRQIPSNAGYVALVNSTDILVKDLVITHSRGVLLAYTTNSTIENVNISNSLRGVHLWYSCNNVISGCTLTKCLDGIRLDSSAENKISKNTISHNWDDGIALYSSNENIIVNNTITVDWQYSDSLLVTESRDNLIYHNNIIHRYSRGVFLPHFSFHNDWDNGVEGNYWNDYNGTDLDENGIGDIPYMIDSYNKDRYPLMNLRVEAPDTVPPIANAGNNQTVAINTVVEFDASSSYDNVGIISYEWDFGDGKIGTSVTPNHTYINIGNYTVTLTVGDAKNNSDSTSIIIEILVDTDEDGTADKFDIDDDGDELPDAWESENGLNPLDPADKNQDPDGDWFPNIEEYRLGMNPRVHNPWKIYLTTTIAVLVITLPLTIIIAFILYRKKGERQKDKGSGSEQTTQL
jgi:parallel beta-helix repeat protein